MRYVQAPVRPTRGEAAAGSLTFEIAETPEHLDHLIRLKKKKKRTLEQEIEELEAKRANLEEGSPVAGEGSSNSKRVRSASAGAEDACGRHVRVCT